MLIDIIQILISVAVDAYIYKNYKMHIDEIVYTTLDVSLLVAARVV